MGTLVAGVADGVVIAILLVGVGIGGAVVFIVIDPVIVGVVVGLAGVADGVAVGVSLVGVVGVWAVVCDVCDAVAVAVFVEAKGPVGWERRGGKIGEGEGLGAVVVFKSYGSVERSGGGLAVADLHGVGVLVERDLKANRGPDSSGLIDGLFP